MGVRLQALAIGRLERAQFFGLTFAGIDRESFINEKVPNLLPAFAGVERLILGITNPAKLGIGLGRLRPVAFANNLKDAFALIDLLSEHSAQIARLGAEDVLPDRLVTKEGERIRGELPAAP